MWSTVQQISWAQHSMSLEAYSVIILVVVTWHSDFRVVDKWKMFEFKLLCEALGVWEGAAHTRVNAKDLATVYWIFCVLMF